jgi:hypothetical protein
MSEGKSYMCAECFMPNGQHRIYCSIGGSKELKCLCDNAVFIAAKDHEIARLKQVCADQAAEIYSLRAALQQKIETTFDIITARNIEIAKLQTGIRDALKCDDGTSPSLIITIESMNAILLNTLEGK